MVTNTFRFLTCTNLLENFLFQLSSILDENEENILPLLQGIFTRIQDYIVIGQIFQYIEKLNFTSSLNPINQNDSNRY